MGEHTIPLQTKLLGQLYEERFDFINQEVWLGAKVVGRIVAFQADPLARCLTHLVLESKDQKLLVDLARIPEAKLSLTRPKQKIRIRLRLPKEKNASS